MSEGDGVPGTDEFPLQIDVATLRESEIEYQILYRVLSSGTATVVSFSFLTNANYDARFGAIEGDPIEEIVSLLPGDNAVRPLRTNIANDFIPENEECFSIQIIPIEILGRRELFMCDFVDTSSTPPRNFFCRHTICIEDDDGKSIIVQ